MLGYRSIVENGPEWSAWLAAEVGKRVAQFRKDKGMTGQDLANECAKWGMLSDRAVISKLEKGHRQTLTVGELIVLGAALGVPPLLLLFPLAGHAEKVQALPAEPPVDAWAAAKRFTGENGKEAPGVVDLLRDHEQYERVILRWMEAGPDTADQALAEQRTVAVWQAAKALNRTRQMMRAGGLTPDPLHADIPAYFGIDQ